jgi:anaerobic magnesium-protoporphyrin IX monomethyl ester cyclase
MITIANICFGTIDSDGKIGYAPIGTLYIIQALENAGIEVDFRNYLEEYPILDTPKSIQTLVNFLENSENNLFISCNSATLPYVIIACNKLKEKNSSQKIILGGLGPTGVAKEILNTFSCIDIVVLGEGEAATTHLVQNNFDNLSEINGIFYRDKNNQIQMNPRAQRIQDLDNLLPAYHKINPNAYSIFGIVSSRGCPCKCTYCGEEYFWGNGNVKRSPQNIIQEIQFLHEKYGQCRFEFVDDTFVLNKKRVIEFCNLIQQKNLNIEWNFNGLINLMDDDIFQAVSGSGCYEIFYGVESASDRILKTLNKQYSIEQADKVIEKSLQYVDVVLSFIWGFPFETKEDLIKTLEYINQVKETKAKFWLFPLTPVPMSLVYEQNKHQLAFYEETIDEGMDKEVLDIVLKYPEIFPGYYFYNSPNFQELNQIVNSFESVDYNAQSVFVDGLIVPRNS